MEDILRELSSLSISETQVSIEILKNTKEVKNYIEDEDVDKLLKTIDLRGENIEKIKDIKEKALTLNKKLDKDFAVKNLKTLDKTLYPEGENIIKNAAIIEETLKEAYQLDLQNQKEAERLLEEFKDNIKTIQQGKQASHAYGKKPTGQSLLINKIK